MFGWCMEFSGGKNVSVPLGGCNYKRQIFIRPKDDAKDEHFGKRIFTVQLPSQAEFNLEILLFQDESCMNHLIKQ